MKHELTAGASRVARASLVVVLIVVAAMSTRASTMPSRAELEAPVRNDLRYAVRSAHRTTTAMQNRSDTPRVTTHILQTAAGEDISIGISSYYSAGEAQIEAWKEFIGSLLHGSELRTVHFYLLAPFEVAEWCGPHAAACYSPGLWPPAIFAPGEDLSEELTAEAILAHEYGHHVANSRPNPPWGALTYGTKRWASYVNVCAAVLAGQYFPGDEGENYDLNPAEGFAEAYRVTNQRRLGVDEMPWLLVDERFYPDSTAMTLIEQDVLDPWTAHNTVTFRGRFTRAGPNRHMFEVSTALDGVATASVRGSKGARFRVTQTMATVCGQRTTYFVVRRVKGFGRFELVVSRP
jgi:hypothetical protein